MSIINEIYKSFFAKDDSQIWRSFAEEQNGKYVPEGDHRIQFSYSDFIVTFDAYTHYTSAGGSFYESNYTRGIVEFRSIDNYELRLTQQGLFENIGKLFGAQDIQTGNKTLDKKFIIKSNDEIKTQFFLSDPLISGSLEKLNIVRFHITKGTGLWDEKPTGENTMLYVVVDGSVNNTSQLNQLWELFKPVLDRLKKH